MPHSKPIEILLIEDSTTDILITQEALHEARLPNHLNIVEDGVKALDFLRQIGSYAQAPRPDLILLDLNLPRKNGQEVLAEIKNDPYLQQIPVVVLTTSSAEEDVIKAYALHANCYVVKPLDFISFVEVIRSIRHFWFTVVTLPLEAENG